jgi:wobble nucleotide-excising tRNase
VTSNIQKVLPIEAITLHIPRISCYSSPVQIQKIGKVNVFYGINGVGKSTLSRYFHSMSKSSASELDDLFANCSGISTPNDYCIHVYNEGFKKANFRVRSNSFNAIVTLDETNTNINDQIEKLTLEVQELNVQYNETTRALQSSSEDIDKIKK